MAKFRIKLKNSRIIGPFSVGEVAQLAAKGQISGSEDAQHFPLGEWLPFNRFEELSGIFDAEQLSLDEPTFLAKISDFDLNQDQTIQPSEEVREFKFEHVDPLEGIENHQEDNFANASLDEVKIDQKPSAESETSSDLESSEIEKTQMNTEYQAYLKKIKQEQDEKQAALAKAKQAELESAAEIEIDYQNEPTQFLSLDDIAMEMQSANLEEKIFEREAQKALIKKKRAKEKLITDDKIQPERGKKEKGVRKLGLVLVVVFLVIFLVVPDDDSQNKKVLKKIILSNPDIIFPDRYDIPSKETAKKFYVAGVSQLKSFSFNQMNLSAQSFRASVINQFDNNPAMHRLIFTYSYLLPNSPDPIQDANTIFKLVLINKTKILKDPYFASAIAFFYYQIGKVNASISIFEKYMTIDKSKPNKELFAVYLKALVKAGRFDKAKSIFRALDKEKNKSFFTLQAIYEYHLAQGQLAEQVALIKQAKKQYPRSVYFDLAAGKILVNAEGAQAPEEKIEALRGLIFDINGNNAEGSKLYYAAYLSLKGMYHVLNAGLQKDKKLRGKENQTALKSFESSLRLNPTTDLIEKLTALGASGNSEADNLITSSRAIKELTLAKNEKKKNNIRSAFKHALEASKLAPNMIDAKIFLADLQIKKGYLQDAINQLKEIYKKNPRSTQVLLKLTDAHIEAYQFSAAADLIRQARKNFEQIPIHKVLSAKAKLALFQGNYNAAVGYLAKAIRNNPLGDENLFRLAKLFLDKYKIKEAKKYLMRAMDLDPSQIRYQILYAKILYELETSSAAIGYLYSVLKDFPDNPEILSEIGIYYYRSGQIKRYKDIKDELIKLPKKSSSLYRFLIESAKLDDEVRDIIKYQVKLVEMEPGDLSVRMELAGRYIDLGQYPEAKDQLEAIKERLATYPRLNYSFARLYLLVDDLDKAREMALKEIKANPDVDETYVILGEIYKKEDNYKEANNYYVKAMQKNPKNTNAILGVAYIAFRNEQHELALDQYQKVIDIDPDKTEVYKLLGDAYRKLGQSQLAIKFYKDFLTRSPSSKYKTKIETYIKTMQ